MDTITIKSFKICTTKIDDIIFTFDSKIIVNTINAHSYMVAKKDEEFKKALVESSILLPDGEGIVLMVNLLKAVKIKKIAGADIHERLLNLAQKKRLKCFYLGASNETLDLIENKLSFAYPNIDFGSFSPPFKDEFTESDNKEMIDFINAFDTNILFVGMTAPKQEKWVAQNKEYINANIICSVGAVFDFVAGTKKRAPNWVISVKMEWLYRSFTGWRLAKRYLISTPLFLFELFKLKFIVGTK